MKGLMWVPFVIAVLPIDCIMDRLYIREAWLLVKFILGYNSVFIEGITWSKIWSKYTRKSAKHKPLPARRRRKLDYCAGILGQSVGG